MSEEAKYAPEKSPEESNVKKSLTIKPPKFFGVTAIICLIGIIIMMLVYEPGKIAGLFLIAFFFLLSIPLVLFSFVVKYDLNEEKISYRNMFGQEKILRWSEVERVRMHTASGTIIRLYGRYQMIKIYNYAYMPGTIVMTPIIRIYCESAKWT